jgi:hypothetical protein
LSGNFFILLNFIAIFVDWLLAISSLVSLPLAEDHAIKWSLEQAGCSGFGLRIVLKQLDNMREFLAAHDIVLFKPFEP